MIETINVNRKNTKQAKLTAIADIEKLSHEGRGIARIANKITFIDGALPGERVVFEYTRRKSDFDEGRVLEVLNASVDRVTPHCPHYSVCGGCSLQHMHSHAQIQTKQALLLEVLARIGHCQPESILPPLTADAWHYRHKARLSVRFVEKKGSTLIGFREKWQPRYIADIHTCPVIHAKVDSALDKLRGVIDHLDDKSCIAQIEVAAGDEDVALIIRHLASISTTGLQTLRQFAQEENFWLYLQPGGIDSIHRIYPTNGPDKLSYHLPQWDIKYYFHPADFTQINMAMNRGMVERAVNLLALTPNDEVLDLFCGLGNFSLPIAKTSKRVMGIEGSTKMVERARDNAVLNQLDHVEFACADLETWSLADPRLQGINKVLLDPPRCGAAGMVTQMQQLNPEIIVYVSCNPATLARDADTLIGQGYRLEAAGVMDMFPHTAHVESIARFIRA